MKPIGIDLFCGAGGFSLGVIQAGYDVRVGVDNDVAALATYSRNLCTKKYGNPVTAVLNRDIKKLKGREIRKAGKIKGEIALVFGGPPCQGFSTSNTKRCVEDPRSQLMWQFIRLVGELKPKAFLIENVPGLLSYKDFVYQLMESLEKKGYVVRINKLDAASYGIPQRRIRVFISGMREDLKKLPIYPRPTHFSLEQLQQTSSGLPQANVAIYAFAIHGFAKEELKDLWWNEKLWIFMNKKTAEKIVKGAFIMASLNKFHRRKIE